MPGLKINEKDSLMSSEMEEFITDTIIIAKVKNSGNTSKMSDAISKKLDEHFGGMWTVLVIKKDNRDWALNGIPWNGTYIDVDHGAHTYIIFRS